MFGKFRYHPAQRNNHRITDIIDETGMWSDVLTYLFTEKVTSKRIAYWTSLRERHLRAHCCVLYTCQFRLISLLSQLSRQNVQGLKASGWTRVRPVAV